MRHHGRFSRQQSFAPVVCFILTFRLFGGVAADGSPEPQRGTRQSTRSVQGRLPSQVPTDDGLSPKQQRDLLKHNFEKMRKDVDELLELATSLHEEINNTSENVLSLEVVEKAGRIEKLAKRVKNAARSGR